MVRGWHLECILRFGSRAFASHAVEVPDDEDAHDRRPEPRQPARRRSQCLGSCRERLPDLITGDELHTLVGVFDVEPLHGDAAAG